MSTLTMRTLRLAALMVLTAGSLAGGLNRAQAQELDDGTFTDDAAGWSVEFDDRVWTANTFDTGVTLSADDGANAILAVFDNDTADPAECVEFTADDFADSEVYLDFETSRAFDAPETDRGAEGGVYTTTYTSDDIELPLVFYIECRELDGATLTIMLSDSEETYEDTVPAFEELLTGIQTGGSSTRDETPEPEDEETPDPDDEETPEPDDEETPTGGDRENDPTAGEVDGDTFTDSNFDYRVTWDDRVWEAELLDEGNAAGVLLIADFASLVIDATVGYEGVDPDECVEQLAEGFEDFDGYSPLTDEPRLEGPEPPRDGAGAIYSFTFTNEDDEESDRVAYIECRPIDDESMIRISIQSTEELLEENVDAFQDVLDAIEIDDAGSSRDETPEAEDETPEAEDETPEAGGNDLDAGELEDDAFTDTALGYALTWDDRVFAAEAIEGGTTAGIFLTTVEDNSFFATFTIDGSNGYEGSDPEQCVSDLAEGIEGFDGYSALTEEPRVDGPTPPRDGAGTVYSFTFTADNGDEFEQVVYIECRPIDDESMVRVSLYTDVDTLEGEVDALSEVLDSIEIDGGGSTTDDETADDDAGGDDRGGDLGPDEETPDPDDDEQAG